MSHKIFEIFINNIDINKILINNWQKLISQKYKK